MKNENQVVDVKVSDVANAAQQVLDKIVTDLTTSLKPRLEGKEGQAVGADGETRMFFPEGIELIDVIVKIGGTEGADVEVKIAGAKGLQPGSPKQDAEGLTDARSDQTIEVGDETKPGYTGYKIIWTNHTNNALKVTFDPKACPLDVSQFTVSGGGCSTCTNVLGPKNMYVYDYDPTQVTSSGSGGKGSHSKLKIL